jgi:hypothetical protein
MRILVACEFSGIVRDVFAALGHDAWSCDIIPSERPGNHIQGDVLSILDDGWDMMIAHPPCTYLANSGVRWLKSEGGRYEKMVDGANFFKKMLNADIPKICVENPIQHHYAKDIIGIKYNQIVHPWMFGHAETKATCLWLKGLPLLQPSNIVEPAFVEGNNGKRYSRVSFMSGRMPAEKRRQERARTYQGIANAMADQWSE